MSNLEHYFENLLYYGKDVYNGLNKQSLTSDEQNAVEVCAQYVIYTLFGSRKAFEKFIHERDEEPTMEEYMYGQEGRRLNECNQQTGGD